MAESCQRADEIDLISYVDDPDSPEWEEFGRHQRECATCGATVQEWAFIAATLQQVGRESSGPHPNESDLVDYHRQPDRLPVAVRTSIEEHLQRCHACRADLDFVDSFKFSFSKLREMHSARGLQPDIPSRKRESLLTRILEKARVLLAPPPVILQPELTRSHAPIETRDGVEGSGTLVIQRSIIPGDLTSTDPRRAALQVLSQYKAAYEACDIKLLRWVWEMDHDSEQKVTQLFTSTRSLAVLIDVRDVRSGADRVSVNFLQVLLRTNLDNRVFHMPPVIYSADIVRHRDSGNWTIVDLKEPKSGDEG